MTFTSTGAASTNCLSGTVPPPAPCCLATLAWLHDQPKASATSEPEPTAADSSSSFSRKHSRALRVNNSLRFSYFSRYPSLSVSVSVCISLALSKPPTRLVSASARPLSGFVPQLMRTPLIYDAISVLARRGLYDFCMICI